MASETVDPINWPLPLILHSTVRPEHHLQLNKLVQPLSEIEPEIFRIRGTAFPIPNRLD